VGGALLATLALVIARSLAPGRHELELDVYVLVLGGMALLALGSWLREAVPERRQSDLEDALTHAATKPARIAELDRLEREIYIGATRSFDLHHRLRPVLREIAAGRLEQRGLELDSGSPVVRAALGDQLWELVRPDVEAPTDRQTEGPGIDYVRACIEELEAV
jgi:hypothetical protein